MIKEEKNTELLAIIYSGVIFKGITLLNLKNMEIVEILRFYFNIHLFSLKNKMIQFTSAKIIYLKEEDIKML